MTIDGASIAGSDMSAKHSDSWTASVSEWKLALALLGVAFASLAVYVALSTLTGQLAGSMPRRYGYVPLTLLFIVFVIGAAIASKTAGISKRLGYGIAIGLVALLAGQLHASAIPSSRAADSTLSRLMRSEIGRLEAEHTMSRRGVLFFVSSDPHYLSAVADSVTIGPKMDSNTGVDLLQSPYSLYWTAQHYTTNIIGCRFAGMLKRRVEDGMIEVAGTPYPADPGKVSPDDFIVVANLGFEPLDPLGKHVKVFRNFGEFEPYFFGRSIKRDVLELGSVPRDEFVIDMGQFQKSSAGGPGAMPDKKFADSVGPMNKAWIENYGLLSGDNSVYSNPNVGGDFAYYQTNRHGVFTYGVKFRDVGVVEVDLDFWEQWGRQIGERLFELEVSWDGSVWASVGDIDPARLNGQKPVSIVLTKANPKVFQFRMKPVAGAKDVPMIQGLRIHKLRTFN